MQVITGKYKGRKLVSLDELSTRPTLARVKESVFDMISDKIQDKVALDLFAGSGALGIECISRGAKKVYFADLNESSKKIMLKNLVNVHEPYEIHINDFKQALLVFKNLGVKFDLVFLDPPYKSDFGEQALDLLDSYNLLNEGAIIVYEQESQKFLQKDRERFIIYKSRSYGLATVTIYKYYGE